MTTTFTTRATARAGLKALFVADGTWSAVYDYIPSPTTVDGITPFLTITSAGTLQGMAGIAMNPTEYTFTLTSFGLLDDKANWHADDAETKLDDLDLHFRQVVRNNPQPSFADGLVFQDNQSRTDYIELGGVGYRTETWVLSVHLYSGS